MEWDQRRPVTMAFEGGQPCIFFCHVLHRT